MRVLRNIVLGAFTLFLATNYALGGDKYVIDQAHSYVGFSVRHMVIANVKGSFADFEGTIVYDEKNIANSSVNVTIKTASINTNDEDRDKHLVSQDFFNVEKFPEMTFRSTKVEKTDDGYVMYGIVSLLGVEKEIEVQFEMLGKTTDPWGKTRIGFEGQAKLDRKDFGMVWNKTMDAGGLVVGNEVKIDLQVEAIIES